MKEIIDRLHENHQIELAKSIMESAGYKVEKKSNDINESSEEHEGWEYWEMPKGYKGPSEPKMYVKELDGDGFTATIYPPQEYLGDTYDDWQVQIVDIDGNHNNVDVIQGDFDSFEEAGSWVDNWLKQHLSDLKYSKQHGEDVEESKDINEEKDLGSEDYILDVVDPAISNAVKSITGDGFDDSSYDFKSSTLKGQGVVYIDKKDDSNKIHKEINDAMKKAIESLGYKNFYIYDKESEYNDPKMPFNSYRIYFRAYAPED